MNKVKLWIIVGTLFFLACIGSSAGVSYMVAKHETDLADHAADTSAARVSSATTRTAAQSHLTSSVASLVNRLAPAVVDINSDSITYSFFGGPITVQGSGSGMIVSSNGYILTNAHVLPVDAQTITVTTTDGRHYGASVVNTDPQRDLALIKINASGLPTVPLGDSS